MDIKSYLTYFFEKYTSIFLFLANKINLNEIRTSVARSVSSRDAILLLTSPMGIIPPTPVVTASSQNGDQGKYLFVFF